MTDIRSNYNLARRAAFERAGGRDEITGKVCENLNAHHIFPVSRRPDLECDVDNLIVIDAGIHHGYVHNGDRRFLEGLTKNQIKNCERLHELTDGARSPYRNGCVIPLEELKYGVRCSDESYWRVAHKAYYEAHREECKARSGVYNELHREENIARVRAWQKAHPEAMLARQARRSARDRAIRLHYGLTDQELRALPKEERARMREEFKNL